MRGFAGFVAGSLLLAMSACNQTPAEPRADKAWVRLPAVAGNPGAAYFTLHGGAAADTLLGVSTPAAGKAELHESMKHQGVSTMQPIRDIALPAGGEIIFAPAGRHVMLFSLGQSVKPGDKVPLTIALASGRNVQVSAQVLGAGDPEPAQ